MKGGEREHDTLSELLAHDTATLTASNNKRPYATATKNPTQRLAAQVSNVQIWQQAEQLFVQLSPQAPAAREVIYQQLAVDQPELLSVLQQLLADEKKTTEFCWSIQQVASAVCMSEGTVLTAGQRVDCYRIIKLLGQGGSSFVYLAERADAQFQQQVAIKLLQTSVVDAALFHAFVTERQILADLEHAAISRLLDGGTTEHGLPYLVMEYVQGQPIDQYCEQRALSMTARLQLMVKVANAVAYAHQKMVIHCDLTPANILISTTGEPKLLDFGIARLQSRAGMEGANLTDQPPNALEYPQRLTRNYASPEQRQGLPLSTLTDVYSLGVVLYQLLTGQLPQLSTQPSEPMCAKIAPTCAQSDIRSAPASANACRSSVPHWADRWLFFGVFRRLNRHFVHIGGAGQLTALPTDLQWILRKATATDPELRYHSVAALGDDLKRFLGLRMVHARPYSQYYQSATFVRRNKMSSLLTLVFLSVLLLMSWLLWQQSVVLTAERDAALQQLVLAQQSWDQPRERLLALPRNAQQMPLLAVAPAAIDAGQRALMMKVSSARKTMAQRQPAPAAPSWRYVGVLSAEQLHTKRP